ncbi:hypothetical protein [Marinimicrobium sp. C2-29]|uniref:hypothetical protein n=1 Tax=Marinimicrobium sp. C2-29 TaxID=3139825 RepID=UPI00313906F4
MFNEVSTDFGGTMKQTLLLGLVLSLLALSARASEGERYHCAFGQQGRTISVVYEVEGQAAPCEVRYEKENGVETPWSADNEEGYCEEKAREFVEQHREWGWRCDPVDPQNTADRQAPAEPSQEPPPEQD